MSILKSILVLIWRIWMIILSATYIFIFGIFVLIPIYISPKNFRRVYPLIRGWGIFLFYCMGFKLKYSELTNLKENENYIFIANHTSMMDIMVMLTILKKYPIVFVGKAELAKIPIFGRIYKNICIIVDRKSFKSRANVYPRALEKLKNNLNIFIFPEGGVSDDLSIVLDNFKDGAFNIAIETQTPIAVYSIKGLKEMYPFNWFKGYPGTVEVKLLEIIPTKNKTLQDKTSIKNYAYDTIKKDIE